jgi:aryl-alcohol dehydrogenase-like predicted oxidoreductase
MRTRTIGELEVSAVGLGCNNFGRRIDADATQAVVDAAIEAGVTLFDTADVYGDGASEELLGRALGSRRDQVVIATKFGMDMPDGSGASPAWARQACEDSLRRLGTDHIDLYQLHRPDEQVPIEETLGALAELVAEGKVREIGCSNFDGTQVQTAEQLAAERGYPAFVSAQNHWSLLTPVPEDGLLEACEREGLVVLPFFPLESGLLTGKYAGGALPEGSRLAWVPEDRRSRFLDDERLAVVERLTAWAAERGHTILDLAVAWLASQELCASVIAGATRPDQVRANVAAGGWQLSADEVAEVAALTGRDHRAG